MNKKTIKDIVVGDCEHRFIESVNFESRMILEVNSNEGFPKSVVVQGQYTKKCMWCEYTEIEYKSKTYWTGKIYKKGGDTIEELHINRNAAGQVNDYSDTSKE